MRSMRFNAVAFALCAAPVSAQSFNLDFGDSASGPSPTYAAAGLPGYWNALLADTTPDYILKDLAGNTTNVHFHQVGGFVLPPTSDASVSGDDALLLNDGLITHNPSLDSCFYFYGLAPGNYELITYAWRPNDPTMMAKSFVDNTPGLEISGGAWPGMHVHGVTYARHVVTVTASGFMGPHSGLAAGASTVVGAVCNGMQLRKLDPHPTFCFGDGTGVSCPCGNTGGAGNGCSNSIVAAGAHLGGNGVASVTADTLVLSGTGMPNSSVLYFQGTLQQSGGQGFAFGDGLRCAGGFVLRLGTKINSANASIYPAFGDTPISIRGAIPAGGATRTYQAWYRNTTGPCGSGFNLTNGVQVTWTP
jgi:hypothetical protein